MVVIPGVQTLLRLKNTCYNMKLLSQPFTVSVTGGMAGQPGGGHGGCILPSKAISTEVHFDNLRVKRWTGSEALVSFPNTRTLIRDKLILAAFIFDFLSDYTEPLK